MDHLGSWLAFHPVTVCAPYCNPTELPASTWRSMRQQRRPLSKASAWPPTTASSRPGSASALQRWTVRPARLLTLTLSHLPGGQPAWSRAYNAEEMEASEEKQHARPAAPAPVTAVASTSAPTVVASKPCPSPPANTVAGDQPCGQEALAPSAPPPQEGKYRCCAEGPNTKCLPAVGCCLFAHRRITVTTMSQSTSVMLLSVA